MPVRPKPEPPAFIARLSAVVPVEWRAMFGGFGIYSEGVFFGLVSSQGIPYLRRNDASHPDHENAGSEPFQPYSRVKSRAGMQVTIPHYEVPEKVRARSAKLRRWAEKALEARARRR